MIKKLEKFLRKNSFFSKVASYRPATLLTMNSFTGLTEHIFLSSTFSLLLLFITPSKQKANPRINSHDDFDYTYGKDVHEIKSKECNLL